MLVADLDPMPLDFQGWLDVSEWARPVSTQVVIDTQTPIYALALGPDQEMIISGETIKIWDLETGELLRTLEGHQAPIETLLFSPDGLADFEKLDSRTKPYLAVGPAKQ